MGPRGRDLRKLYTLREFVLMKFKNASHWFAAIIGAFVLCIGLQGCASSPQNQFIVDSASFAASVNGLAAAQEQHLITPAQHTVINNLYVLPGLAAMEAANADLATGNTTKLSQDLSLLEGYTVGLQTAFPAPATTAPATATTKP